MHRKLLLMAALHFVAMYFLMYAMVDRWENIFLNINKAYMAGLMTSPMLLIEGFLMSSMYEKKILWSIMGVSAVAFILCFLFIRKQTAIEDTEFLRSMIPHHSGAILMCEEANIQDPEMRELCDRIIVSQREEIEQMKRLLLAQ